MGKNLKTSERIIEIIAEAYKNGDLVRQNDIVQRLNGQYGSNSQEGECTYKQPAVSKSLDRLLAKELISKDRMFYLPKGIKYAPKHIRRRISEEITFSKPKLHKVSSTTWVVPIEGRFEAAKYLLTEYLGENHVYDIIEFNKYLIVMVKGEPEERKQMFKDLSKLVEEQFNDRKTYNM